MPALVNLFSALLAMSPPAELQPAVAAQLDRAALRIEIDETTLAELWAARPFADQPTTRGGLRILYPQISPGTLIGVVRFSRTWEDARGQPIPAGVYTLRYAVQPLLKEHTGVSEHRDFVVVIPAASDDGRIEGQEEAIARSRSADGSHPSVLALVPPGDAASSTAVIRRGQLTLGLALATRPGA
jgi:hypothetical protein